MLDEKRNNPEWNQTSQETTVNSRVAATRAARNQQGKKRDTAKEERVKNKFWVQVRILPIWLRIILVLLLLVGAAVVGAMIGYGYIGDGNPGDVLKKETWTHVLDIMRGNGP